MAHGSGQRRPARLILTTTAALCLAAIAMAGPDALLRPGTVAQVYAARDRQAIWVAGPELTAQARGLLGWIAAVEADGLDPADYHLPELHGLLAMVARGGEPVWADAAAAQRAEYLLTDAFLAVGHDLAQGRVDPAVLWKNWSPAAQHADVLARLQGTLTRMPAARAGERTAAADSLIADLTACRPAHAEYQALRQVMIDLAGITAVGGWPTVDAGRALHPGDRDQRSPQLRARLMATGALARPTPAPAAPWQQGGDPLLFDEPLAAAVRAFQRSHGLDADGVVGARTLAALNVTAAARAAQVALNLERWRWQPQQLGRRHIRVNIPDYSLAVIADGAPELTMRAIVGRPDRPTPVLSSAVSGLVLNPRWNVPQKLAREDLLPKLAADPGYLAERGIRVFRDWRPGSPEIDPATVDWSTIVPGDLAYKFQQEAGPRNPLGRIKFTFPNEYAVYIHDTDQRGAFAHERRCLSSGCVRVEDPQGLLAALVPDGSPLDTVLQAALGDDATSALALPARLPVHLMYLTAWIDAGGVLQLRDDCYGYDLELAAALAARRGTPAPVPPVEPLLVAWSTLPAAADPGPVHQVRTGPVSMWTNPGPE